MGKNTATFLIITLLVHTLLFIVKGYLPATKTVDGVEQEHFVDYVKSLKSGNFPDDLSYTDTRFFPGLPLSILGVSIITGNAISAGLFLTMLSLVAIYLLSNYLTKDPLYSFWITIFPPIVLEQTSKISTEAPIIALFLLIYLLFIKKKYNLASLLGGFATIIRPVGLFIYLPVLFRLTARGEVRKIVQSALMYLIFPGILLIFNQSFFGDILYQMRANSFVGQATVPIVQMFSDIFRHLLNGNLRPIISGLIYLAFSLFLFFKIIKNEVPTSLRSRYLLPPFRRERNPSEAKNSSHSSARVRLDWFSAKGDKTDFLYPGDGNFIKLWTLGTFLFIFSIGPIDFLSLMRRFLSVFYPLALVCLKESLAKSKIFRLMLIITFPIAFL